jgi:hypothetical protein
MDAFYERDGELLRPAELTRGPWDPGAQHAGPPSALLARAIERLDGGERMRVGRVTVELLGPVPIAPVAVTAEVVRPGRSVELCAAALRAEDGRVLARAAGWRLRTAEVALPDPPPGPREPPASTPADGEHVPYFPSGAEVGFHTAMEYRFVSGSFGEPGPAVVWLRMRVALVAGEDPSPLERVLCAADSGNGVSGPLDYRRYLFINTDLTVHLHRFPETEWICLDALTLAEPNGVGMSDTLMLDERGRIGRAVQTLFVRER